MSVFVGRQLLLPVFEDFGVELPIATQYLLHFYSPYLITIASLVVLLAMFMTPYGSTRRRFVWLACITGVLIGVVCLLSFLVPLSSLWQNLTDAKGDGGQFAYKTPVPFFGASPFLGCAS